MTIRPPEDLGILDSLAIPHPPADLRAKTLAAARRAATQPRSPSRWQSIRSFFAAQPRWTTALAVLLAAHLLLGAVSDRTRPGTPNLPRNLETDAQPDLLRLPRIERMRPSGLAPPHAEDPGKGDTL